MALRTGAGQPGRVGGYIYVFPLQTQARKVIWNGIDGQGRRFIHAFPPALVENKNESEMFLRFKNGSTFQVVGGDDPDKLVGQNPVGIVFSEYALTNPQCWRLIAPILAENGGWVIFNSTPRGYNHFRDILEMAQAKKGDPKWYDSFETAKTLKVLTPQQIRDFRDEINDEALFQQEMFCSFDTPLQGAYYSSQVKFLTRKERLMKIPIDPALPVDTAWDLGMDDATAIWFIQPYRGEYRLVDYYENSGEGLTHYANYVKQWLDDNDVCIGENIGPHDLKVRELSADGKSRLQVMRNLGLKFRVAPKMSIQEGIQATRELLQKCYIDTDRCYRGWDAIRSYSKEYDSALQKFKDRPKHDWTSHPCDALRVYATGKRQKQNTGRADIAGNYNPSGYRAGRGFRPTDYSLRQG
jgi:phage terminase large subunit